MVFTNRHRLGNRKQYELNMLKAVAEKIIDVLIKRQI